MLNPRQSLHALDQLRSNAVCSGAEHDTYRVAIDSLHAFVDAMEQRAAAQPQPAKPEAQPAGAS